MPTPTRRTLWLPVLLVALCATMAAGVVLGPTAVGPAEVWDVLAARLAGLGAAGMGPARPPAAQDGIVWGIRLPRVVLAVLVGAGLAVVGAVLQTLVRNPLADPYLLGVNSGASVGAAAALVLGTSGAASLLGVQGAAVLGAALASLLVLGIAGRVSASRLLLAGVAVGYALSALTSLLVFASDSPEATRSVMFWLLGSLAPAAWGLPLAVVGAVVPAAVVIVSLFGPRLDALALGDEPAASLGVSPQRLRLGMAALSCVVVGVVVAAAGSIGFVGLVVPHLARALVGPRHRLLAPVAALLGGILTAWADVLARVALAPQELPLGIVTALLGAPFVLFLLRRV